MPRPGGFIPLSLPAIWDPNWPPPRSTRVAKKGCHAVTFSENPEKLGWPSLHSEHWDPFWAGLLGGGHRGVPAHRARPRSWSSPRSEAPIDVLITLQPMNVVQAAADLLWSPVLRKFPDLRIALSEGGIGWIPYFLERVDYVYQHHQAWTGQDFGDLLPSQVFKERIITCFIDDAFGVANRHYLNMDNITWECDYPHSDSTWPQAPGDGDEVPGGVPDDEVNKITHLQRHAPLPLRPLRGASPRAVHGRPPCGAESPTSTPSFDGRDANPARTRGHVTATSTTERTSSGTPELEPTEPHAHPLRARRRPHRPHHHRPARGAERHGHRALRPAPDGLGPVRRGRPAAWVAVVTGVGLDFCVGADLKTYIPQITSSRNACRRRGSPRSTATASTTE